MNVFADWKAAWLERSEATFARIASAPGATLGNALLYVFLGALVGQFITAIGTALGWAVRGGRAALGLEELGVRLPAGGADYLTLFLCGIPLGVVFVVVFFIIMVALTHWVAGLFGGVGSLDQLVYATSAIAAPGSLIFGALGFFNAIPFLGAISGLVSLALSLYTFYLNVLAVKGVHGLDTPKAVGAVLAPGLGLFLVLCCCVALASALLGPALGNVLG